LNQSWVKKFKNYLKSYLDRNNNSIFHFNINELDLETEEKIYCLINKNYSYNFIKGFVLVTSDFVEMISSFFNKHDKQKLYDLLYPIIIGGNCIIRRVRKNDLEHYITLLYDENKSNSVDYALIFKNRKTMEESLDFILKNNFIIYFQLINYKNELNKEIRDFDTSNTEGFIFRNCDKKQGLSFLRMKYLDCSHEKKEIDVTNKNIIDKNNDNNNSNINNINKNKKKDFNINNINEVENSNNINFVCNNNNMNFPNKIIISNAMNYMNNMNFPNQINNSNAMNYMNNFNNMNYKNINNMNNAFIMFNMNNGNNNMNYDNNNIDNVGNLNNINMNIKNNKMNNANIMNNINIMNNMNNMNNNMNNNLNDNLNINISNNNNINNKINKGNK